MEIRPIAKIEPLRLANKNQAAAWFGVSVQALDGWIRRGCPAVERGATGKAWVFDLRALAEWRYKAPDVDPESDPEKLSPKDRLDWYRGTREKTRHMMEAGDLIPARDYELALSNALKTVAMTLESLPDLLERDAALPPEAVDKSIAIIDRLRDGLYKALTGDVG
jgi:phage terminase Nu1 subunit (DNA packaging protein)